MLLGEKNKLSLPSFKVEEGFTRLPLFSRGLLNGLFLLRGLSRTDNAWQETENTGCAIFPDGEPNTLGCFDISISLFVASLVKTGFFPPERAHGLVFG